MAALVVEAAKETRPSGVADRANSAAAPAASLALEMMLFRFLFTFSVEGRDDRISSSDNPRFEETDDPKLPLWDMEAAILLKGFDITVVDFCVFALIVVDGDVAPVIRFDAESRFRVVDVGEVSSVIGSGSYR
mmetsp:Transcript_1621/g.3777  ORF Transcript_1621/g.3777 Transcript_1621/m.3777 type:complete len:133 (-) Transcript_1621:1313-1711(-)